MFLLLGLQKAQQWRVGGESNCILVGTVPFMKELQPTGSNGYPGYRNMF